MEEDQKKIPKQSVSETIGILIILVVVATAGFFLFKKIIDSQRVVKFSPEQNSALVLPR